MDKVYKVNDFSFFSLSEREVSGREQKSGKASKQAK